MKKQKAPNPNKMKNTGILCHRERGRQSNASDLGKNENVVSTEWLKRKENTLNRS
jgi:hypothetical protein